jgi:plasmid stabilization system protein ParE
MTNYPIRYLPAANWDLMDIMDYIMVDNPEAAYEMIDKIDAAITRLGQFPPSCPEPDDERLMILCFKSSNQRNCSGTGEYGIE